MASTSSRLMSRLSPRLQSLTPKVNMKAPGSPLPSPLKSTSSSTKTRLFRSSRLPVELSTMMPLYTAIASARLISSLSMESKNWGLVIQGISMPL